MLVRVAVAGAVVETLGWLLASLLTGADAWRHDISTMSAVGGRYAWLVLAGEAGLALAVLALAALVHRSDLRGDHAAVASVLLVVSGLGFAVQAVAQEGGALEAAHAPTAGLAVFALGCAPVVLAVPFRAIDGYGGLAAASVAAAGLGMVLFAAALTPGLTGGLCQRAAALVLSAWVAVTAVYLGDATVSTFANVPQEERTPG